jgi:predicted thioesterase
VARQRLAPSVLSKEGYDCRVYSTLNLLYDIGMTCRNPLLAHIDAGKDSVGTRVELDHIGATLLGMWVDINLKLAEVNGNAVEEGYEPDSPCHACWRSHGLTR